MDLNNLFEGIPSFWIPQPHPVKRKLPSFDDEIDRCRREIRRLEVIGQEELRLGMNTDGTAREIDQLYQDIEQIRYMQAQTADFKAKDRRDEMVWGLEDSGLNRSEWPIDPDVDI